MITIRQSKLTKHWVVERGHQREGFRRWEDAMSAADQTAQRLRSLLTAAGPHQTGPENSNGETP